MTYSDDVDAQGIVGRVTRWRYGVPAYGEADAAREPDRPLVIDIYARISVDDEGSVVNIPDQVRKLTAEVKRRGAVVGEVFPDQGRSAWNPRVVRKNFQKMMERLEGGESDGVIFYNVSRFSRQILEGERMVAAAQAGLKVWSFRGEYDLMTAEGRTNFRRAVGEATADSDKKSEAIRDGQDRRAHEKMRTAGGERGFGMPGWAPKPEGWEPGDPRDRIPDDQVAAERVALRDAGLRALAGETAASIARDLNEREIYTTRGNLWTPTTLVKALRRPSAAGLLEHKGAIVGRIHGVEPAFTVQEWELLCGLFDANRRGRPYERNVHLLTGTFACGQCGVPISARSIPDKPPYPDGAVKREYRCRKLEGRAACGHNRIDARVAEASVDAAMRERLSDPETAYEFARRLSMVQDDATSLRREILALEDSADTLATKTHDWGAARVDLAMAPILRKIADRRVQLERLERDAPISDQDVTAAVQEWEDALVRDDLSYARTLVKRAFPDLVLEVPERRADHRPERLRFDGMARA